MLFVISKIRPALIRAAVARPGLSLSKPLPLPIRRNCATSRFLQTSPLAFDPAQQDQEDTMAAQEGGKEGKKSGGGVTLKTPKGTRDWAGEDMLLRDEVFKSITDIFKRHGGSPLDTPVFELKEILAGKYGEDQRLVYDLGDQGGEICSLRYDLTVPFARWLAMNNVQQIKRYHLAKVYRRDQPAIARGRYREFHQCDFDIAGVYDPMIPDAEILRIIVEVFEALDLGITIKLNHRKILDGMFAVAGVPAEKTRTISSAVDKLDKMAWPEVKKEMVEEKGLAEEVADRIGEYVLNKGTVSQMVEYIRGNEQLIANETVKAGVDDMALLGTYLDAMEVSDKITFDLSLARGLDYYTGLIYEVINLPPKEDGTAGKKKLKKDDPANQVGSIAAGGRYDNLVGMYGKKTIPCVGISFGVDRIFTILKARRERENAAKTRTTDVYVMAFGGREFNGLLPERMSVASKLWKAGIRAEYSPKVKPKLPQQFKAAEDRDVPLGIILGQDELAAGQVRLKQLGQGGQGEASGDEDNRGKLVSLDDLAEEVKKLLL